MITVTLHCGQCSEQKSHVFDGNDIPASSIDVIQYVAYIGKGKKWCVQKNGDHIDTYCSRRCAA